MITQHERDMFAMAIDGDYIAQRIVLHWPGWKLSLIHMGYLLDRIWA